MWKVKYTKNGKEDVLWFGSLVTKEEAKRRISDMKENGFKIIRWYQVKSMQ